MPLQKLNLRPGVSRESTSLANEGGWYACDKVRFRSGQPENIGGWTLLSPDTFLGACRSLFEWETLASPISYTLLGLGTNLKYYILSNETFYDITPLRLTIAPATTGANPILPLYTTLNGGIDASVTNIVVTSATTIAYAFPNVITIESEQIYVQNVSGTSLTGCIRGYNGTAAASHANGTEVKSTWVTLYAPSNGAVVGDYVTVSGATAFGPYSIETLNQNFEIQAVAANYVMVDTTVLSSSATVGGGAGVTEEFEISTGATDTSTGSGWGAGTWVSMVFKAGASTLSGNLAAGATSVVVASTASFSAGPGYFLIESEVIQYTAKAGDGITFTGCTRGISGTGDTDHGTGVVVTELDYVVASRAWNVPAATTVSVNIPLRLWSANNFGQDLVMNIRDSAVFYWTPTGGGMTSTGAITTRAVNITALAGADAWSPTIASRVIVSDERHVIVIGTNDPTVGSSQDPMLIRWCEQEDPATWLPTQTNTAGFQRVSYGSKLITAEKTRQEILIWSDTAIYSMRYLGPPYIYGINVIATDISIASPNAVITANNVTYWMGHDKFYAYSGRVDTLPCALRQYLFDDLNKSQLDQIVSGRNEKFNEVWWFYCSASSNSVDRYVVFNYLENIWYYGNIVRSAWYDSQIRAYPIGAGLDGKLYLHEYGTDDASTNPSTTIDSYITSADFDIGDGDSFSFIQRLIPDIDFIGSTSSDPTVSFVVNVRNFPGQGVAQNTFTGSTTGTSVTLQVYNYTNDLWLRLRGRQAYITILSNTLGTKWQLGVPRIYIQPDGRKS